MGAKRVVFFIFFKSQMCVLQLEGFCGDGCTLLRGLAWNRHLVTKTLSGTVFIQGLFIACLS